MRRNESKQTKFQDHTDEIIDTENNLENTSENLDNILQLEKKEVLKLKYEYKNLQKTTQKKNKLGHKLILHTDNGVEFVSKEYCQFINENEELIGSTSTKGSPTKNSIVERWNRLFKSQRNKDSDTGESFEFPKVIKTTQQLQTLIDKKINYLNNLPNDQNFGASPNEYKIYA